MLTCTSKQTSTYLPIPGQGPYLTLYCGPEHLQRKSSIFNFDLSRQQEAES